MNQQQAALIARLGLSDADIAVMFPNIPNRHYQTLREWGANGGTVQTKHDGEWVDTFMIVGFFPEHDYRLAPRTVTLSGPGGTFELPEPQKNETRMNCWTVRIDLPTQEAAEQWADALSKVMGVQS